MCIMGFPQLRDPTDTDIFFDEILSDFMSL